jgi:DNA polymerase-3 subunit beta
MPGEQVDVSVNADWQVAVTSKNSKFLINGTSGDDYPEIADVSGVELSPVDSDALKALLDRTAFSASTEDSRPNICGVFFECVGEGVARTVTTDGHRLSQCERNIARGGDVHKRDGVIIPNKGAAEMRKMLDDAGPDVALGFANNQLAVSDGDQHLFVRLIDAAFPDYAQVIPKSTPRVVVIERTPLMAALKRIGIMASDRTHGVRIDLSAGRMVMTSDDPQSGSSRDEMDVGYDGAEMSVGFNAKYVREALAVMTSERVDLALVDALSPCVIREHGCNDSLCLVMPMRL